MEMHRKENAWITQQSGTHNHLKSKLDKTGPHKLPNAQNLLKLTNEQLQLANHVNNAQCHLKRKFYALASSSIEQALDVLNKNQALDI